MSSPRSLHDHLKGLEERLRRRQDKGRFWWELRSCSYYSVLEGWKVMYQEIQYAPAYSWDTAGQQCNYKIFVLPIDSWLLAVLNSPLMWWHNWRYLVHLKDEALSPQGFKMEALPIAPPLPESRDEAEEAVARLVELTRARQQATRDLADWLMVEHGLTTIPTVLRSPFTPTEDEWVAATRAARGRCRPLSSAGLRAVRDEYHAAVAPLRERQPEVDRLERRLAELVFTAYGLDAEQIALVWRTAPPRMPSSPPQPG